MCVYHTWLLRRWKAEILIDEEEKLDFTKAYFKYFKNERDPSMVWTCDEVTHACD